MSLASKVNGRHPLEARLEQWEDTQFELKMEGFRRTFGSGEPIRRAMELEAVKSTDLKPMILGGPSSIHDDILKNKDNTVTWEEIYPGSSSTDINLNFHAELEKRMGI